MLPAEVKILFSASPEPVTRVGMTSRDGEASQWCRCLVSNPSVKWQMQHCSNRGITR